MDEEPTMPPYELEEIPAFGMRLIAATDHPLTDEDKQKAMHIMRELLDDMKDDR